MLLKVTPEESQVLKSLLEREYSRLDVDLASRPYLGHSPQGMELCRERARIASLMERLEAPQPVVVSPGRQPAAGQQIVAAPPKLFVVPRPAA